MEAARVRGTGATFASERVALASVAAGQGSRWHDYGDTAAVLAALA